MTSDLTTGPAPPDREAALQGLPAARVDAPAVDAPLSDDPISDAQAAGSGRRNRSSSGGMIRNSAVTAGMTLISRVMGFARDLAVSYTMGASADVAADAYNTALMFPNVFRRIFAEGAFATAFVPAYARALARDGEEAADVLAEDAMAVLTAATLAITLAAELCMTWIMYGISSGYAHDPHDPHHIKFNLAVTLTRITMPYLPFMAVYAHLSGVLNARGRFVVSGFAPTLLNVVMLIAVLPQKTAVGAAHAAAWGVLVAGFLQAALLWWGVGASGGKVSFRRLPRFTPEIRALVWLALPGAFAASATQINILVSNFLASQVNGARSWLATADRLYQLPLGLVGVAIGVALLPRLSTAVQARDPREEKAAMDEALVFALALTLPAAAALVSMPFFLIDALFTRGEFHIVDARATAAALFWYGWGTPAFVLLRILSPAYFARQDTRTPMRYALVSVAANIVLGLIFFRLVGFQGIAAATACASWLNAALMFSTLVRRGQWRPDATLLARLGRVLLACLALGGLLAAASHWRHAYQPYLFHRKEIAILVVAGGAAGIYGGLLLAVRAVTPAEIRAALRRRPRGAGLPSAPGADLP